MWGMPNWNELLVEIRNTSTAQSAFPTAHDSVRRRYLSELHKITGRNVILYYSGWLQYPELTSQGVPGFGVDDLDKNGFMATIHELDRSKGLDLILHTPGGEVAATESLVNYLRSMFGTNIRAIIPQMAMSSGTMVACAAHQIVMGKHSSIGPIDPQVGGIAAHGIIEEFRRAQEDVQANPILINVWQPILSKYYPTMIGDCQKAIEWAKEMVRTWLATGMFANMPDASTRAERIVSELADHEMTRSHSRQLPISKAQEMGLTVVALEDDQRLQDAVLSLHHASMQTLADFPIFKLIENQNGVAVVRTFEIR
jgi:hypothetical protein